MKKAQDAFGQAMYDCFHGRGGFEVVERDDGHLMVSAGPEMYFQEYSEWPGFERRALRHVAGRVLDIGCGAGRIALYLQEKGHDVVGIDNSPMAIQTCRERGLEHAEVLPITRVSSRLGAFDTIVMFGNNFGLVGGYDRARWLLSRFYSMTSEKGRILAQANDPHQTKVPAHLEYHAKNRRRGRLPGQLRIRVRYKGYSTAWLDYLLVSKDEMEGILEGTGWFVSDFIDSDGPSFVGVIKKAPR